MPQPLPVAPPAGGPSPNQEEAVNKWDSFLANLSQPGMSNSLLAFGLTALSDKNPGESSSSHFARSLGTGVGAFTEGTQRDLENERKAETLSQSGRQVGAQEQNAQTNVKQAETQAAQQQATATYQAGQLENAAERNRILEDHYKSFAQKQATTTGGKLSYDDALNIARQKNEALLKSYESNLQYMENGPERTQMLQDYAFAANNMQRNIINDTQAYMALSSGKAAATGGGGYPTMTPDELAIARAQGASEERLQQYLGPNYAAPSTGGTEVQEVPQGGTTEAEVTETQETATEEVEEKKAGRTPEETLRLLEERIRVDDEIKGEGFGGQGGRAIRLRAFPLGMAGRKRIEQRIEKLRQELNLGVE